MESKAILTDSHSLIESIIKDFEEFNPNDTQMQLPNLPGNYVVLLKKETPFPTDVISHIPIMKELEYNDEKYLLIYTGVADNIKQRIKYHLGDNAGRSTLRLSLGCLQGYIKINRDRQNEKKKFKFKKTDEQELTEWMKKNLLFLYCENPEYADYEEKMISLLNPPLNIQNNKCEENAKFRKDLSSIRSKDTQYEDIIE